MNNKKLASDIQPSTYGKLTPMVENKTMLAEEKHADAEISAFVAQAVAMAGEKTKGEFHNSPMAKPADRLTVTAA